ALHGTSSFVRSKAENPSPQWPRSWGEGQQGFYAGYGIEIGNHPTMLSELRAPGANLATLGALIFTGVFRSDLMRLSAALGTVVFLAFAFGRLMGIVLDGMPAEGIVTALAIELVAGALCLLSLRGTMSHGLPATLS
ncbi:MAG: DUF4345 domain-containing protein, partial [Pseudomonadota bacterium]